MNTDDFEQQLERQSLQRPPAAWREEILGAARQAGRAGRGEQGLGWLSDLRALLARVPGAWTALAAVWVVIIGVNSLLSGPAITIVSEAPAPASPDTMTVWNLQRAQIPLLVNEWNDVVDIAPPPGKPRTPPDPRSDGRREEGFGELEREASCALTV